MARSAGRPPETQQRVAAAVVVDLPITLGQFVKLAGFASTGGEAKQLVTAGMVRVNGEPETRRGRKLASGDVVETAAGVAQVTDRPVTGTLSARD